VYYKNLDAVRALIDAGASLDVKLRNGEDVVTYAEKIKAPVEIIEYLKHARAAAPAIERMERQTGSLLVTLGQKKKQYAAFLTHHKRDAAAIVGPFRADLARRVKIDPSYIFLDSEDLQDLRTLKKAVEGTLVLFVILTKDVFTRPWCLVEIYTAIQNNIPILSVAVEGQGNAFDYGQTQAFLQSADFPEKLEAVNPGAVKELEGQGIDVAQLGALIGGYLPYVIAKSYNVAASERIRHAQLEDIVEVFLSKV